MKKHSIIIELLVVIAITILTACNGQEKAVGATASTISAIEIAEPHLQRWEGLRLKAYTDVAGVATIGYGSTNSDLVAKGQITKDEALAQLRSDMTACQTCIENAVTVELTPYQKAALISFVYNVGGQAFRDSTLLKELNAGNYSEVPTQLRRWKFAGGKVIKGLINRREAEINLWNHK